MTPSEVAQHITIPLETLKTWRAAGKGPKYLRIGKHVRYRREAVEGWLNDQTGGP